MTDFKILKDERTFSVVLVDKVKDTAKLIEMSKEAVVVRAKYVYSLKHLMFGVNRGFSLHKNGGRTKFKDCFRETVYLFSSAKKTDTAIKQHSIVEGESYYVVSVDGKPENIAETVGGEEIHPYNYANFTNNEFILKEYDISEEEQVLGIEGALINRVALKEL